MWSCHGCGRGFSRSENFYDHSTDQECKPLFDLPNNYGRYRDKNKHPWGCPPQPRNTLKVIAHSSMEVVSDEQMNQACSDLNPLLNGNPKSGADVGQGTVCEAFRERNQDADTCGQNDAVHDGIAETYDRLLICGTSSVVPSHEVHERYPIAAPTCENYPVAAPSRGSHPVAALSRGSQPVAAPSVGSHPVAAPSRGSHPVAAPSRGSHPVAASSGGSYPVAVPFDEVQQENSEPGYIENTIALRKSKRQVKKVDYAEKMNEDISDISDISDSEEDVFTIQEQQSESSSEEEQCQAPKDWRQQHRSRAPLTDIDSGDDAFETQLRQEKKRTMHRKIYENLKGPVLYNKWMPDSTDLEYLETYICNPVTLRCGVVTHLESTIPGHVMDKIRKKQPLAPEDRVHVAKTGKDYSYAWTKGMYILEQYFQENDPLNLSEDQHLHMRQFFEYGKRTFIKPINIVPLLNQKVRSANMKMKIFEAYKCLLDQQFLHASTVGRIQFITPQTEEEKSWSESKMIEKGEKRQQKLLNEIRNLQKEMHVGKPFAVWRGACEENLKLKKDNEKYFAGQRLPNPEEILSKWIKDENTIKMEKLICEYAKNGTIVSGHMLNRITNYLISKFGMKIGARPEIFEKLCYSHLHEGQSKGPAAFPYKHCDDPSIDTTNPEVAQRIMNEDNSSLYVRKDPWSFDPLDSEDVMQQETTFQIMKGTCLTVKNHKTGKKYPYYVWLSQLDLFFLLRYEEICFNYTQHHGLEMNPSTPIFMNAQGKSYLGSRKGVDLSDFARIVGLPKCTMRMFRDLFSNTAYNHGTAVIKSFEQFGLCHTSTVAVQSYVDSELKKSLSLFVNAWFRNKAFGPDQTLMKSRTTICANEKQAERLTNGLKEMDGIRLNRWIDGEQKKDDDVIPTSEGTITNSVRKAVLQLIARVSEANIYITKKGSPLEVFLTGAPAVNYTNVSILSRTFYKASSEWDCTQVLEKNLLIYASLMAGKKLTPRELEVKWIYKLLECLDKLRRGHHVANIPVLNFFVDLSQKYGNRYCLKNSALENQVDHWERRSNERKEHCDKIYDKELDQDCSPNNDQMAITQVPTDEQAFMGCSHYEPMTNEIIDHEAPASFSSFITDTVPTERLTTGVAALSRGSHPVAAPSRGSHPVAASSGSFESVNSSPTEKRGDNSDTVLRDITNQIGPDMIVSSSNKHGSLDASTVDLIEQDVSNPMDGSQTAAHISNQDGGINPDESNGVVSGISSVATPNVSKFAKCWEDHLKLDLLKHFILYADDPMLSNVQKGHQRLLIEQCATFKSRILCYKGQNRAWKEFTSTVSMGHKMYRQVTTYLVEY